MEFLTDPVAWWFDPFADFEIMRRALIAGLLAVVCTSVVGTWVILRGMSFIGDALAHGVLPGVALALVLGVSPTLGAVVAALAMVGGLNVMRRRSPLPEDASIGVLFVGFLALAVVIVSTGAGSSGDLNRFLFGSILGITPGDLVRQAVAAVLIVVAVVAFYRAFLVLTFDETQASLLGLRPQLAHGVLMALVALAIVATFEAVGNLLVFAFLIAPPATAALVVKRVPIIMLTAVAIGALSVIIGLLISFHAETATGATMALVAVVIYLLAVLAPRRRATSAGLGV